MGRMVRGITAEDIPDVVTADWAAFGIRPSDEHIEDARGFPELDRTFVAVDRDQVVGTAGALSLELTVPGPATVSGAGINFVGVRPTLLSELG